VKLLRRPGFRLLVEAVAIVLAAVIAGLRDVGAAGIIAAVAVVWVIVALIEYSLGRPWAHRRRRATAQAPLSAEPPSPELPSELPASAPPPSEPPPAGPPPETVPVLPRPPFEVAVELEPVADEPEPQAEPHLEPHADAELEPQPDPEPQPEPVAAEPRQWNIWELERAVREGGEPTEEQEFLLLYLRDYADPAGLLPLDFDDLVRESFGDALGAVVG